MDKPRIIYHQRTSGGDGQGLHIREMISAFRQIGVEVVVTREPASNQSSQGTSGVQQIKRKLPHLYDVLLIAYNLVALLQLFRKARGHFDFIYERYSLFAIAGVLFSRLKCRPILLEVNSPLAQEEWELKCLKLKWTAELFQRFVLKQADCVVVVTEVLGDILAEDVPAVKTKLLVTPNAIRAEMVANRHEVTARWSDKGPIVFGFVGWCRPWNGLDRLILEFLWAGVAGRARLCLVGDGPEMNKLVALARELNLQDQIEFTGPVPHHSIPHWLRAFHVALVPDANAYCSPMKLYEYMGAGKATIAPDQPNLREAIRHGYNGYLYQKDQDHSLGEAIRWFVQNPEKGKNMCLAAIDTILTNKRFWTTNAQMVLARGRCLGRNTRIQLQ